MYPEEKKALEVAFAYLSEAVTSTSPSASQPDKSILEAITQIIERWPPSTRFPGPSNSIFSNKSHRSLAYIAVHT